MSLPTYEELVKEVRELNLKVAMLLAKVEELTRENAELRHGKHSGNSHMPPNGMGGLLACSAIYTIGSYQRVTISPHRNTPIFLTGTPQS